MKRNNKLNTEINTKLKKLLFELDHQKKLNKDLAQQHTELKQRFDSAMSRNAELRKQLFALKKALAGKGSAKQSGDIDISHTNNFELPKFLNQSWTNKPLRPPNKPKI